ncbi:MAG: nucleotidyltransferase domain-containing protein [Coriobacteriia bacterium]
MPRVARVVAFSTSPEMAEEIDALAREEGKSRSELLRAAMRCYQTSRELPLAEETAAVYAPRAAQTSQAPVVAPTPTAPAVHGVVAVLLARPVIRRLCESLGVAQLWLFGSAVRDDFEPGRSDYDFLVEFRPDAPRKPWAGEYHELREGLEQILDDGPVEIGHAGSVTNPYVKASIDAEKVLIYEWA